MPDLNDPARVAHARQPRGAVKINGQVITGWTEFNVDNNRMAAADTFTARFATSDMAAPNDAAWLVALTDITIELFANESPDDPASYAPIAADRLLSGKVDHLTFDPIERVVELSGRDLTSTLIDTKTSENHQNATSSQVATLLATRHGLTPVVAATSTRIGQYYEIDHTDINSQESEWDLLSKLAKYENFDVYVTGNELHFEPKPADGGGRYAVVYTPPTDDLGCATANVTDLNFSRDLTISKGITVTVRSWNAKQKKAFTSAWPKNVKATKPGQSSNDTLAYTFTIPGLTPDQAVFRAQQLYNQIVQHMVTLTADLPGDAILSCATPVEIRGTATVFDQVYYPDSVRRTMSAQGGYAMSLSAKNISQDIEAATSDG